MEQDNKFTIIESEIFYFDNLRDISSAQAMKVGFNAVLHCRNGCIEVGLSDGRQITINSGQLMLVPAYKIVRPIMTSTDAGGGVLFISDKMLKSLLGKQINIWNKAIYVDETYLIDGNDWIMEFGRYTHALFQRKHFSLFSEIMLSYMRTLLLIFCEALTQKGNYTESHDHSTGHEKVIFNQFLSLLSAEHQQRLSVAQCASELHITPKYLSTICKNVSGKGPSKWIAESVMEECYSLLRDSNLSIKEISNRLGFPNSSFFGQYFRKQAGMTPMEYRNQRIDTINWQWKR